MDNVISGLGVFLFWVILTISEIYGLFLAINEGVFSFCVTLVIPPWAILKGFIGLLSLIF